MIDLSNNGIDSLLDMFIFETSQNIEQLEKIIIDNEKASEFTDEAINEIFRIMHTIKGSAAMMMFGDVSSVAHSVEDLFFFIRENKEEHIDCNGVYDLVLETLDYIVEKMDKIKAGINEEDDVSAINNKIADFLNGLKAKHQGAGQVVLDEQINAIACPDDNLMPACEGQAAEGKRYKVHVLFEEGCQMESIRAFDLVNKLTSFAGNVSCVPADIMDNDNSAAFIREHGFDVYFDTKKSYEEVNGFFANTMFLRQVTIEAQEEQKAQQEQKEKDSSKSISEPAQKIAEPAKRPANSAENGNALTADIHNQAATIINVNVAKLDKLMDLVGEMVISEAMVVQNPDLQGLELENFKKAARQLHKITTELQDIVMSIRMVPLADIFQKMHRIVRDMGKKLDKEVRLEIIGEETEVDKNIIKHLSDPLVHLMRNSIDHGIEDKEERAAKNKSKVGTVTLEAKNAGNDVLVIIKDDGRGLDKQKILEKAKKNGLLKKDASEMSDKEIFNLIFLPGFSTNENITEYSGRGVGMDIVVKNIEEVGGSVSVDSVEGAGTTITIKIPLTLAIIDGMNIKVGKSIYTLPTISIKESFRPKKEEIITDFYGNEMIMVRGQCYAVIRLYEVFNVKPNITELTEGIFIMIEQDDKRACIFADELIGQQDVVVKALSHYIKDTHKIHGVSGCTLLGDGSISLILDPGWFLNLKND